MEGRGKKKALCLPDTSNKYFLKFPRLQLVVIIKQTNKDHKNRAPALSKPTLKPVYIYIYIYITHAKKKKKTEKPKLKKDPSLKSPNRDLKDDDNNHQSGIQDEQVLLLVFRSLKFGPRVVSVAACVSRRLRAVARRVLWRELCVSRAQHMVSSISAGPHVCGGGWHALAKLLFYCCGSGTNHIQGHFVQISRFSKTSGKSFLHRKCWGDLLYVSDPCEHSIDGEDEDLGVYRGVFRGFMRSKTRECLISKQVGLEGKVRCPYCGDRVWSMTGAKMVPRSASRRLGSHKGSLEYFVCVNGHLHGNCWLVHLSDDDGADKEEDEEEGDDDDDDDDGHIAF